MNGMWQLLCLTEVYALKILKMKYIGLRVENLDVFLFTVSLRGDSRKSGE